MAEQRNIRIEDDQGNQYFPHSKGKIVFMGDGKSVEEAITQHSGDNTKHVTKEDHDAIDVIKSELSINDTKLIYTSNQLTSIEYYSAPNVLAKKVNLEYDSSGRLLRNIEIIGNKKTISTLIYTGEQLTSVKREVV